jgi:hypothetical protein
VIEKIFAGASGNQRMAQLFRCVQGQPITRDLVEAVAQQHNFMRHIRNDNGRGTRDLLAREGILLLSGQFDAPLIAALGLPRCSGSEVISYSPATSAEVKLAAEQGVAIDHTL